MHRDNRSRQVRQTTSGLPRPAAPPVTNGTSRRPSQPKKPMPVRDREVKIPLRSAENLNDDFPIKYERQERQPEFLNKPLSSLTERPEKTPTVEQPAPERTLQKVVRERDEFLNEVQRMTHLLAKERSKNRSERNERMQLEKELEETKKRLAYQIHLKQFYIKKLAEARNELMRLQKYKDAEFLYHQYYHNFICNMRGTVKHKKDKLPKTQEEKLKKDESLIQTLRAEHEALRQKMAKMAAMQKDTCMKEESRRKEMEEFRMVHMSQKKVAAELQAEKETALLNEELERIKAQQQALRLSLWREVEGLKTQLSSPISLNLDMDTEREDYEPPCRLMANSLQEPSEELCKPEELLVEEPPVEAALSEQKLPKVRARVVRPGHICVMLKNPKKTDQSPQSTRFPPIQSSTSTHVLSHLPQPPSKRKI